MSPLRKLLTHLFTTLLLTTAYLAALDRCADNSGSIPFTYPKATINQFTVGDTMDVAWQFPSPGQHSFDLDLVLPNETLIGAIAKGVEVARATATTSADALNCTIPEQLNSKTVPASNYQFTIRSSDPKGGLDLNPSRSPVSLVDTNISCYHLFRTAARNSSTRCTEDNAIPRPTGTSIRTQDGAVSFAALVVALSFAIVLLR